MSESLTLGRREFLRAGLLGSALLAGGASVASLSGCSAPMTAADGYLHLVPVILAGALPNGEADVQRALKRLDTLFDSPSQGSREALFKLYDVLQLGAFRWWVMDAWAHPASLNSEEIDQGMAKWSRKQNSFARLAFNGLCQPLMMCWYTDPDVARSTGYPGPPRKVNA